MQRVNSVYADTILNRVYTNADKASRLGLELGIDYRSGRRFTVSVAELIR
nr:hypothetical protein [Anseongella ginsenosidimutans]